MHYEDKATPKQRSCVSALSGGIAGGGVTKLMGTLLEQSLSSRQEMLTENQ